MEGGADDIYGGESGTSTSSSAAQMHRTSEAAQMRAMRLQQELLLREAEECTFHPRINSRQGSTIKVANPEAFFNRTQQWKEQIAHDNEDRRKKIEEKALVECTFAPNVLPSPRRMSSGSARGSTSQAAAVAPSHRAPASAREVTSRLYQPQARIAQSEELDRKRDERRQQEEAECSFHPSVNKPLRTNVATNVASRYRRGASPAKRLPPPTGEEQCTFSPAVNRTPRALSHAVAEYLDDPAHLRLSRQPPPSPREAPASAGRGLTRSASAPRFGDAPPPPSPGGTSDKGDEMFAGFLERQAAHLHRKRVAEQARVEAVAHERAEMMVAGRLHARRPGEDGAGAAEGAPAVECPSVADESSAATSKSFLQRVAEQAERKQQRGSSIAGDAKGAIPTDQADECTFHPHITHSARARRARSVEELSTGELARRARAQETKRVAAEERSGEGLTFRPNINEVPGVQSRLKVASEPSSYLARVRQHMRLKEQLTACVREAQESQELAECTFHPQTHEAPAYISRIARSVKQAKQMQPAPVPSKPDWR